MSEKNDIKLVWAVEVDAAILGARLEAHLDIRYLSDVLTVCYLKKQPQRDTKILNKFVGIIAENVGSLNYQDYKANILEWQSITKCARRKCGSAEDPCPLLSNKHFMNYMTFMRKANEFERKKDVIQADFGLVVNFSMINASAGWRHAGQKLTTMPFSAYLTLPISKAALQQEHWEGSVYYAVEEEIEPTDLIPLPADKELLFHKAIDKLSLKASHTQVPVSTNDKHRKKRVAAAEQHTRCLECESPDCKGVESKVGKLDLTTLGFGYLGPKGV